MDWRELGEEARRFGNQDQNIFLGMFYYYVMRRSVLLRRFHRGMDFQTLERMLPLLYVPSYSHDKLENVEKQTKMDTFLMFNLTRV